ncbi:MAG TPA: cytochrome c [Bradyrhizobium sp.]|uniref:c-type cytochrome n=1 Tax=Bradyrhizobium sp. TaxID=376 RepID=UPI002D7F6A75|nr:cytochrome c [Bradyrhizobium sp.]HET7886727.1 cytochrome c [Bradyrhizobium sp.]
MMRTALVVGALLLGAGAVMAQQDVAVTQQNLMKSQGRSMYGVLGKMIKGETPYDQAAIDKALNDLQADVAKIPTVFTPNPKEDVVNANFGSSQKIWQNKADFDGKVPAVIKAIEDTKGKIKDAATLKAGFDSIQEKCTACHDTYRVKLK